MEKLIEILKTFKIINYKLNEPLKNYTSFKIGGNAKILIMPSNQTQANKLFKFLFKSNYKWVLLGNATNVLISDLGFDGVVVKFGKPFNKWKLNNNVLCVDAGMGMFELNRLCVNLSLSGLEWSYGIPGTVGGAVRMNSGCFGHSISEVIKFVKVFDGKRVKKLNRDELQFDYRNSIIKKKNYIVLNAGFELNVGNKEKIEEEQNLFLNRKKSTQPYSSYSAGSVFKRHNDVAISKLIDELGLKGFKVNDAEISKMHAGFIINNGQASCNDVLKLIEYIRSQLLKVYGIQPELEIEIIGETNDTTGGLSHTHNF